MSNTAFIDKHLETILKAIDAMRTEYREAYNKGVFESRERSIARQICDELDSIHAQLFQRREGLHKGSVFLRQDCAKQVQKRLRNIVPLLSPRRNLAGKLPPPSEFSSTINDLSYATRRLLDCFTTSQSRAA